MEKKVNVITLGFFFLGTAILFAEAPTSSSTPVILSQSTQGATSTTPAFQTVPEPFAAKRGRPPVVRPDGTIEPALDSETKIKREAEKKEKKAEERKIREEKALENHQRDDMWRQSNATQGDGKVGLKRVLSIESRGIVNLVTSPGEVVHTFKSEKKAYPKVWPATYLPRLLMNSATRIGSSVYDIFLLPWYAPAMEDPTPLTRHFDMPDYVWKKE